MNRFINSINQFYLSVVVSSLYFIWTLLPIFTAEYSPTSIRMIFYIFLILGVIISLCENGIVIENKRLVFVIISTMLFFVGMSLASYKDASKYLIVVCVFWLPLILNNVMGRTQKIVLTKIILIVFSITTITSTIGVTLDNSVARTIAHAISDDSIQISISRRNIAGIYLFQMIVVLFPSILGVMELYGKKKLQIISVLILLFVLLNASFSIALLLAILMLALIYYILIVKRNGAGYAIIIFGVILGAYIIFMIFGEYFFDILINSIDNARISERLLEIKMLLFGEQNVAVGKGDVVERIELYRQSLDTFFANFITGVGPYYSFIKMKNGIGFHSQILDDLARFGLLAVLFYYWFIREYYNVLLEKWMKYNMKWVASVTVFVYCVFILLNLGFRSEYESSIMLIVIPNIPLLLEGKANENELDENSKEYIL